MLGTIASSRGAAAPFTSPLQINWYAAYWAEDPDWSNPGNGNAVSNWRDGRGRSRDLTQATGSAQPTYRSSVAALNNQPAVEFATDFMTCESATFGTLAQPYSIVIIFNWATSDGTTDVITGSSTSSNHVLVRKASSLHNMHGGSAINGGTIDANGVMQSCYFNGASSNFNIDGTDTSGNAGTNSLVGFSIMRGTGGTASTHTANVAFAGVYLGDVRSNSKWSAFKTWASSHYDISIV